MEPERLVASKGLSAELLVSAKADRPPDEARRKALLAASAFDRASAAYRAARR
jgi:hypothetical protein